MAENKTISIDTPIFNLVEEHPDLIYIMVEIGYAEITTPKMLNTVGRYMTLKKGAKLKKLEWPRIIKKFEDNGYTVL